MKQLVYAGTKNKSASSGSIVLCELCSSICNMLQHQHDARVRVAACSSSIGERVQARGGLRGLRAHHRQAHLVKQRLCRVHPVAVEDGRVASIEAPPHALVPGRKQHSGRQQRTCAAPAAAQQHCCAAHLAPRYCSMRVTAHAGTSYTNMSGRRRNPGGGCSAAGGGTRWPCSHGRSRNGNAAERCSVGA